MTPGSEEVRRQRLQAFEAFFNNASSPLQQKPASGGVPEAWFLGSKAENEEILHGLVREAISAHCNFRREFFPNDPAHITDAIKQSPEYRDAIEQLRTHARDLFDQMRRSSVPFSSMRYQSHMLWDQALPAMVGYIGAMLYNQNNVAAEASPLTTWLEIVVGNDLCRMLGYDAPPLPQQRSTFAQPPKIEPPKIEPWGHITCDGSVANIEALWAARNAKFFATALRRALDEQDELKTARALEVRLLDGTRRRLVDIDDPWTLLNLPVNSVVDLPETIRREFQIDPAGTSRALRSYAVQNIGLVEFYDRFLGGARTPVVMAPATRHYSWPKAVTLLGLGQNSLLSIAVDLQARMDVAALREELDRSLTARRPVIAVVAVIGSTEESAVDPLQDIIDLRRQFRAKGLDFTIHCDAAWGGYFNTLRIDPAADRRSSVASFTARRNVPQGHRLYFLEHFEQRMVDVPSFPMNDYVNRQYAAMAEADSITVDPHKAGYVPYPAGAVCYRNSAMRDLISLKAPVVFHSKLEPTVGIYGVEGSKPGAAAAATWLAHRVIPLTKSGYGKILGQCMWTSKRMYCRLATMDLRNQDPNRRHRLVPFQALPAELNGGSLEDIARQRRFIADHFVHRSNSELLALLTDDPAAQRLFGELGSDQVILAYTFNFKSRNGSWNTDPGRLAQLNQKIFDICSIMKPDEKIDSLRLILTSSEFSVADYGRPFIQFYSRRLEIDNPQDATIPFLISTTMDPWTTETDAGDFLAVVERELDTVADQALKDLGF